jgi:hypothetical protein
MKFGRWYLDFRRYRRSRYWTSGFRSGGRATPGPWWQLAVRGVGELTLSRDRTLFGWDDEANR